MANYKFGMPNLEIPYLANSLIGRPNLENWIFTKFNIWQKYLPQTKQQPCSTVNSFAVLPGRLVKWGQQNGLFGELQTCWAEYNLFPWLPTVPRCCEASLVKYQTNEPAHWQWKTGQPDNQEKVTLFNLVSFEIKWLTLFTEWHTHCFKLVYRIWWYVRIIPPWFPIFSSIIGRIL